MPIPLWRVGTKLIFMFEYREPETRLVRCVGPRDMYEKGAEIG